MHSVIIVQRRMTEYRLSLFERLRVLLANQEIELAVIQGTPSAQESLRGDSADLEWATSRRCRYVRLGESQAFSQHLPRQLLEAQDLVILPHEGWMIANNLRLVFRRPRTPLLGFWGHGANFQAASSDGWRERLKSSTVGLADWWFAYTALSVDRLTAAGYPKERITCLNNAVDTAQLGRWRQEITESDIQGTRDALGLRGHHTAVFIGSLHPRKRLDFLVQAADRLRDELGDFELIVIGDGPLKPLLLAHASVREWLKVVGSKHGRDKVLHALLGDVILNPGMVGLGILDSLSFGLPLVTTDCGMHSPEIAYLRPGQNGVMTPDEVVAYVSQVASLLRDRKLLASLATGCREDATQYTVEGMATNFAGGIQAALELGKRP